MIKVHLDNVILKYITEIEKKQIRRIIFRAASFNSK